MLHQSILCLIFGLIGVYSQTGGPSMRITNPPNIATANTGGGQTGRMEQVGAADDSDDSDYEQPDDKSTYSTESGFDLFGNVMGTQPGFGGMTNMGLGMGTLTSPLNALNPLTMTLIQAQAAPSVESICTARNMMLNPRDAKGVLSDLVGKEVSRRAQFLKVFPHLAGTGKWACAASFYSRSHPPGELGNLFGDLIDTTGCSGFTCNVFSGPKPVINNFMNAFLMSSMLNNMGPRNPPVRPAYPPQPTYQQPVYPPPPATPSQVLPAPKKTTPAQPNFIDTTGLDATLVQQIKALIMSYTMNARQTPVQHARAPNFMQQPVNFMF